MASVFARKLDTYQPQEQQQKQTKVQVKVHKKRWISKGEKVLYSFFVGVTALTSAIVISYSANLDSVNRDVQELETKVEEKSVTVDNLQAEVKELSEPSRILQKAKENGLQMQNSKVEQANKVR
ncbi:cell division protein FtsL [Salinibacillus kushneri]|uniref:Cell division protein FtsL n=1 Tax=Salinibacillus kushneri TaxID=237682 RepID=A0A1I0HNH1_9BACI|nr:cell division protein FtsL [Salinibacillus kushneri]SET85541.1 cell division protein FtsL [Salinibacillus kushneri]